MKNLLITVLTAIFLSNSALAVNHTRVIENSVSGIGFAGEEREIRGRFSRNLTLNFITDDGEIVDIPVIRFRRRGKNARLSYKLPVFNISTPTDNNGLIFVSGVLKLTDRNIPNGVQETPFVIIQKPDTSNIVLNGDDQNEANPVDVDNGSIFELDNQGIAGPQGPRGPRGFRGPRGAQGPAGESAPGDVTLSLLAARRYSPNAFINDTVSVPVDGTITVPQTIHIMAGFAGTGWLTYRVGSFRACYQGLGDDGNDYAFGFDRVLSSSGPGCASDTEGLADEDRVFEVKEGNTLELQINGRGCDGLCEYTTVLLNRIVVEQ